jgi:hypothetical protein
LHSTRPVSSVTLVLCDGGGSESVRRNGVEYEELELGGPEDRTGLSPLAWIALAVACVLAGVMFLIFRGPGEPVAGPVPDVDASPSGSGLTLAVQPAEKLQLGRICPAVTDGRTTLIVSFNLVNVSTTPITVMDVRPVMPIGGLRPRGPNTAGGTCEHPGSEAPGGLLAPGATQLVTMRFRLPEDCPQAFPVEVRIRLRVHQMVGTTTVPVHSELGSINFDSCPGPAA